MGRVLPLVLLPLTCSRVADGLRPDRYCLSCLCTAATGCNTTAGCLPDGGRLICGPFYMSEPYWQDSELSLSARFAGLGERTGTGILSLSAGRNFSELYRY